MATKPNIYQFINSISPIISYTVVSLIVLGPLLRPGFILTLDMVFGPKINLAEWFYGLRTDIWGELPVWGLMATLNHLIPMWLVQKLLLFAILFMAGYSAYRLSPVQHPLGRYFSGLLYMLNPFVYVRFMAGQWQFLAGYALTPLAIKSILSLAYHPGLKEAMFSGILVSLIGMFSPHMMVMVLAASIVIFLFIIIPKYFTPGDRPATSQYIKSISIFIFLLFVLSFYWLIPAFTHKGAFLLQIGQADLDVFSARPLNTGGSVFLALVTLHGFWRGGYQYINQIFPLWYLPALFFIFLAIHGFLTKYRDEKIGNAVKAMGVIGIIALLLGSGVSSPYFSPIYEFLFNKVFFLRAFRDSQKLVALLVLSYSYLGSLGAIELYRQLQPKLNRPQIKHKIAVTALSAIILASPFIYSLNMLGGFKGQLKPVDYPLEWQEANIFLHNKPGEFTTLFLPWHGFITFSWVGQRVATPAKWFFDKPILQSQSIEVGPIENVSTEPAQQYMGFLLENRERLTGLGKLIAPLNIKYIILAKEVDFKEYNFLFHQSDLKVVLENSKLVILENQHPTALFYTIERLQPSVDWVDFLENGKKAKTDTDNFQAIKYQQLSPVRYRLKTENEQYVVTSMPYDPSWQLDGVHSEEYMNLTNSFHINNPDQIGLLYYRRYGILLLSYIVSGAGVVVVGILWVLRGRKLRKARD